MDGGEGGGRAGGCVVCGGSARAVEGWRGWGRTEEAEEGWGRLGELGRTGAADCGRSLRYLRPPLSSCNMNFEILPVAWHKAHDEILGRIENDIIYTGSGISTRIVDIVFLLYKHKSKWKVFYEGVGIWCNKWRVSRNLKYARQILDKKCATGRGLKHQNFPLPSRGRGENNFIL